ncbi:unnamed protein product [Ceutorhynchus assimilis]|uniref:Uncharacterized protein n=1 Tax=Ceutorhynchus assimilis TaxID=467358 RepID=A0A9N9QIN5_9CUCU|nr:unnamed protein product [Ceutorhynchus assimilis]
MAGTKDATSKNLTMIKQDIRKTQKIMAIYKVGVFQTVITYFAKPLFVINEEYRLPMASYFPWNIETSTNFLFTYVLQVVLITSAALLNTSIDVCFAIFCTIVSTELRVLKNNLMNMDYSPLNRNVKIELRGKNVDSSSSGKLSVSSPVAENHDSENNLDLDSANEILLLDDQQVNVAVVGEDGKPNDTIVAKVIDIEVSNNDLMEKTKKLDEKLNFILVRWNNLEIAGSTATKNAVADFSKLPTLPLSSKKYHQLTIGVSVCVFDLPH